MNELKFKSGDAYFVDTITANRLVATITAYIPLLEQAKTAINHLGLSPEPKDITQWLIDSDTDSLTDYINQLFEADVNAYKMPQMRHHAYNSVVVPIVEGCKEIMQKLNAGNVSVTAQAIKHARPYMRVADNGELAADAVKIDADCTCYLSAEAAAIVNDLNAAAEALNSGLKKLREHNPSLRLDPMTPFRSVSDDGNVVQVAVACEWLAKYIFGTASPAMSGIVFGNGR